MQISTIIVNIDYFKSDLFSNRDIGIEIQTFPQHILDTNIDPLISDWQQRLMHFNGPVAIHGSSFDLNPGSTDQRILDVTRYRYLQSVQIAEKLNANHVIFHSQVNPMLSVKRIRDMKRNNQIEFWKDLIDHHIPKEINIYIENEYDDTHEDMKRIIEGVDRANFGVCLDVGHVLAYSKMDLEAWFSNLGEHIRYLHLHWNDGGHDEHRRPTNNELLHLGDLLLKYGIDPIVAMEYGVDDVYEETDRIREHLMSDKGTL